MLDGAGSVRAGAVVSGFVSTDGAEVEAGGGVSSCFTFFFARFVPFFLFLALGKIARDDYRERNQFALHTPLYVFFLPSGSYAGALLNLERPPQ